MRSCDESSPKGGRKWKWSNGVEIIKMGIVQCISITNNVNSYKKFNEKAQTANFSDLTRQRLELCAENAKKTPKLEKLKRKLLKFLKRYDLYRVVPWESWRPDNYKNVVVFEFWRFQTIVIGRQSWVKIEEQILRRGDVQKKRPGHNFEFWALKLNQRWTNMVVSTLIQFQAVIFKIVAVCLFFS